MTDRAFLCRMKALYEKEGGLIVRLLDRKQQIRTWIWEQEEGKDSIVGPDDQRMKKKSVILQKRHGRGGPRCEEEYRERCCFWRQWERKIGW